MRIVRIAKPAAGQGVAPDFLFEGNRQNRPIFLSEDEFDAIATSGVLADEVTEVGLVTSSDTAPIGYTTGAGGAVTQITSISTGVTLSKPCGQITTVASTLAAAAEAEFVVTNTLVDANDVIAVCTTYAGGGTPIVYVRAVSAGAFTIGITNVHASSALDAVVVINFAVIKGVTS